MPRRSPYPTAEGCQSLVLDIDAVMRPIRDARRKGEEPPAEQCLSWTRRGGGEPWAWVDILVEAGPDYGNVVLRYDVAHPSRPTGPQVQSIEIAGGACGYGGLRWYWICPRTGERVRRLYLPNGGTQFLSRDAYKLRWLTTASSPLAKSHMRLGRLAKKLGAEYRGFTREPPPKPKWMRWPTYERLAAEWQAAAGKHDAVWYGGVARRLSQIRGNGSGAARNS